MFDIPSAISSVSAVIDSAIKRIWPDATAVERDKINQVSKEIEQEFTLLLNQIEVNKLDAKSEDGFQSRWRPFIGWICGIAFAYATLIEPLMSFILVTMYDYTGLLPKVDTDITLNILGGILGLTTYRTYEKKHNLR